MTLSPHQLFEKETQMPHKRMIGTVLTAAVAIACAAVPTTAAVAANSSAPSAIASPALEQASVPPALRVPPGNHLVTTLQVLQGVQVYTCTKSAWTFTEPDSDMGITNRPIVLYTAGPEWISTVDGSAVWGSPIASVDRTGTIPELLVKSVKNRGAGLFGQVDYIQRLDTIGGLAPEGACTDGTITASQYFATEKFWAPGHE
jgi:hypothetical protein